MANSTLIYDENHNPTSAIVSKDMIFISSILLNAKFENIYKTVYVPEGTDYTMKQGEFHNTRLEPAVNLSYIGTDGKTKVFQYKLRFESLSDPPKEGVTEEINFAKGKYYDMNVSSSGAPANCDSICINNDAKGTGTFKKALFSYYAETLDINYNYYVTIKNIKDTVQIAIDDTETAKNDSYVDPYLIIKVCKDHIFGEIYKGTDGKYYRKCERCGYEKKEHVWSDYTVTQEPTCETPGSKYRTCTECGEKQTVEIAALGHTYDTEWSMNETHHYHLCLRCGAKGEEAPHGWKYLQQSPTVDAELTFETGDLTVYGGEGSKSQAYTYTGDGEISVASSNTDVATASVNENTVTVEYVKPGTSKITVSAPKTKKFNEISQTFEVTCEKTKLTVPTLSGTSFETTGQWVGPQVYNFDGNTMTQSGTVSSNSVGNYSVSWSLKDTNKYCWADGSIETKSVAWNVVGGIVWIYNGTQGYAAGASVSFIGNGGSRSGRYCDYAPGCILIQKYHGEASRYAQFILNQAIPAGKRIYVRAEVNSDSYIYYGFYALCYNSQNRNIGQLLYTGSKGVYTIDNTMSDTTTKITFTPYANGNNGTNSNLYQIYWRY